MNHGDDARLHLVNEAWGRGYLLSLFSKNRAPHWMPGATGSEFCRGFNHATAEVGWLGAVDVRSEAIP